MTIKKAFDNILKSIFYKVFNYKTYNYSVTMEYDDSEVISSGNVKAADYEDAEDILKIAIKTLKEQYNITVINVKIWEQ